MLPMLTHTLRLRYKNLVQAEANFWICISASLEVDVVAVISATICLQVKWFLIMYGEYLLDGGMLFSCQFVIIFPILCFFSVGIGPIPEVVLVLQMQLWLCCRKSSLNSNPN